MQKNCRRLVFWVFSEQLLSHITFEPLHCYEVTLVKKYNKPLFQKSQTKTFDLKRLHKKLVPSQWEKHFGVLSLNQIMSTLLTISKCSQLNCSQIQQLLNGLNLPSIFTFHVSHTTWSIIDYSWKLLYNFLTSYTKLCYVKFKSANQKCSTSKISLSMLNGALVIQMINNSFSESKKNFGHLRKRGTF